MKQAITCSFIFKQFELHEHSYKKSLISLQNDVFDFLSCKFLTLQSQSSINLLSFFFIFLYSFAQFGIERMQKCSKRSSHWTFRQFYPKNGVVLIDALGELRRERVFFFSNKEKSASDPTRSFCYFFSFLNYSIGRATLYHNLRRRRGDVRRQREWRMTPMRG